MNLLNAPRSMSTACLQYLASLLAGKPRRLMLLWRPAQEESFEAWFETHVDQVLQLRRLVLLVSASLYRNIVKVVDCFPWRLCSLADARLPATTRARIAAECTELHD